MKIKLNGTYATVVRDQYKRIYKLLPKKLDRTERSVTLLDVLGFSFTVIQRTPSRTTVEFKHPFAEMVYCIILEADDLNRFLAFLSKKSAILMDIKNGVIVERANAPLKPLLIEIANIIVGTLENVYDEPSKIEIILMNYTVSDAHRSMCINHLHNALAEGKSDEQPT